MIISGNDIAAVRTSYKPQKLQAKSATVEVACGSWWTVGQAGRKNVADMPGLRRGRAPWNGPLRELGWRRAAVQPGSSGWVVGRSLFGLRVWIAVLPSLLGGQHPE